MQLHAPERSSVELRKYDAMESYKVSFNANEQVAAACQVQDIGSKYDASAGAGTMVLCAQDGGKYGQPGWSQCQSQDTIDGMMKYAD